MSNRSKSKNNRVEIDKRFEKDPITIIRLATIPAIKQEILRHRHIIRPNLNIISKQANKIIQVKDPIPTYKIPQLQPLTVLPPNKTGPNPDRSLKPIHLKSNLPQ